MLSNVKIVWAKKTPAPAWASHKDNQLAGVDSV